MSDEEKIREIITFFLMLYAPEDWEERLGQPVAEALKELSGQK